jgi:hypothetical protein
MPCFHSWSRRSGNVGATSVVATPETEVTLPRQVGISLFVASLGKSASSVASARAGRLFTVEGAMCAVRMSGWVRSRA